MLPVYAVWSEMPTTEIPFAPDLEPGDLTVEIDNLHQSRGGPRSGLNYWPDDWVNPQDPMGFLQWYSRYQAGARDPASDEKMKRRWWLFKQRHLPLYLKSPSGRRAQSLRNWAIDPVRYLPSDARAKAQAALETFRARLAGTETKSATETAPIVFEPVRFVPAPAKVAHVLDWKTRFREFLWEQENTRRQGYANQKWASYTEDGRAAIGPGLRIPEHTVLSSERVNALLDEAIHEHYDRARRDVDSRLGTGAFSKLSSQQQWGLTDFYYTGVPAPKLAAAMLAGDTEAMRRESQRFFSVGDRQIPLQRRNDAWWQVFGPAEKSAAKRLGAGVLFKQEDGSYLLQYETEGAKKGKLRPAGGGKDASDKNLRATIVRELGEEFGLEPDFVEDRLSLLGFIKAGEFTDCALYEMTDHGLRATTYQASNDPKEKVTLVEADLGDPRYIGPLPGDLRQAGDEQETAAAWPVASQPARAEKTASTAPAPRTGPHAILAALKSLDLDALEAKAKADIASGKVTRRGPAVKVLNAIAGLRRNNLRPEDMMVSAVPVVPPAFRPYAVAGDTFIPGDSNELYNDLFEHRRVFQETKELLGDQAAGEARLALYDAQKALYGYGDPASQKLRSRGVSGFLKKVVGPGSPKFSWVQRKMLSKPQDNVGRGTIIVDPDLGLDEVGIPKDMAWVAYAPHVQRRLVRRGMKPIDALKNIQDRSDLAMRMLQEEIRDRPVIYSRAPAWHKFSVLAGNPKLIDGDAIAVNPYVTAGLGADFDGDQINFHVPALDESVDEARDVLFPSKMLFSIRSPDKVMPVPKHESLLGLYAAQRRPAAKKWVVPDEATALKGIERGEIDYADEIEIKT